MYWRVIAVAASVAGAGIIGVCVYAATALSPISDLISTSAPSTPATHTLHFRLTNTIPAGGKIIVTPVAGSFTIPAGFGPEDVDLGTAASDGGPYTQRPLALAADFTRDGVNVVTGASGSVTITLNSSAGINAGTYVEVLLGTNASFGASSDDSIENPATIASYPVTVLTRDNLNILLDTAQAVIAVVAPVGLSLTAPIVEPTLFNGLPTGLIAANNTQIELSLESNIPATCRYATTTGVLYANMTEPFLFSGGRLHYTTTSGYQNNLTYNFYVRCISQGGAANSSDYLISFTIKPTPFSNTSIESEGFTTNGETGDLGKGGSGDFTNGSASLYLSDVTFSGLSIPNSLVTILKDGAKVDTVQVRDDGTFTKTVRDLERGSYGFQLYTQSQGLLSSLYGTTITITQGTQNEITNIIIPPTISTSQTSIQAGDKVDISGGAPPLTRVQLEIAGQSGSAELAEPKTFFATTTAKGLWSVSVDTKAFAKGVYAAQAVATFANKSKSPKSKLISLSVGSNTSGNFNRSDINRDGKVNLVDFSILLSFWQTANPDADINEDGIVNLGDFSIMLFNWTG